MDGKFGIDKLKYVGNYELGKTLGEGTFGKVRLATHILTYEKVAIKILDKTQLVDPIDQERLTREIRVMKSVDHPSLIRLHEVIDTTKHMFLILEYAPNGELFEYIVNHEKLKEKEARDYFRQVVSGVAYLHSKNIIHRDLKPENLLLGYENQIKIADFGFSTIILKGSNKLRTFCGSPAYAAPEMISGKDYFGPEVDVWSLGVILFAMTCGHLPFDNSNLTKLYQLILKCEYKMPSFLSADCRNLIEKILVLQPNKRATLADIMRHPWLNSGHSDSIAAVPESNANIDSSIIEEMSSIGFDRDFATNSIIEHERNQVTTTYWLLVEKKIVASIKTLLKPR